MARAVRHKFLTKWEGHYVVEEAHQTRHYWLKDQAGIKAYSPISGAHLNKYYARMTILSFVTEYFLFPQCLYYYK